MDQLANITRVVRVDLTKDHIDWLIDYAKKNGFKRNHPTHTWDLGEQNRAAKWAILHIVTSMQVG